MLQRAFPDRQRLVEEEVRLALHRLRGDEAASVDPSLRSPPTMTGSLRGIATAVTLTVGMVAIPLAAATAEETARAREATLEAIASVPSDRTAVDGRTSISTNRVMIASVVDRLRHVEMMEAEGATAIWIATTEGVSRTGTAGGRCMARMTEEGAVEEEEEGKATVGDGEVGAAEAEDQGGAAAEALLRWLRG